jgi:hypothetical protein
MNSDETQLTRVVFSSSHFSQTRVKGPAFAPNNNETSVFLHGLEPKHQLFESAKIVADFRHQPPKAVAILTVKDVRAVDLYVEKSEPPRLHANIKGWVADGHDFKADHKDRANQLAQRAELYVLTDQEKIQFEAC